MSQGLFDLTGKIALVTGASRGLGAGMALALADAGADVAVHASTQPPLATEAAIWAKGRQSRSFTANLEKREETLGLVPAVLQAFGRIDILVNNAATMRRAPAAQHPDDMWDDTIEVNLSSVFFLSRAAGVHMLERGGGGKIVNIASMLSFQGGITVPSYAAAKGGVAQVTKALGGSSRQRECDCPGLYGHGQHQRAASRPRAQPANRRADSGRAVGNARRPRRRGGVSLVARLGLRKWARSRR